MKSHFRSLILAIFSSAALAGVAEEPRVEPTTAMPAQAAAESFPGLRVVLSDRQFKKMNLDRLDPKDISSIDEAINRYYQGQAGARRAFEENRYRDRFGLPDFVLEEWKEQPPLRARVVKWEGGNSFRLDNGQVWKGFDSIPYELPGRLVEIQPRARGQFNLAVDGFNTTARVQRIK